MLRLILVTIAVTILLAVMVGPAAALTVDEITDGHSTGTAPCQHSPVLQGKSVGAFCTEVGTLFVPANPPGK